MITSFVLRLVLDDLDAGVFAGEVQHVPTGAQRLVGSADELLAVLRELGTAGAAADRRFT